MFSVLSHGYRRLAHVLIALILGAGLIPLASASAQDDGDVPGTPVTVTFTTVDIAQPGKEWEDAAGNYHLRDEVTSEVASGDIEGTGSVTINGDFLITGECNEEFCEGEFHGWVDISISNETGGWNGYAGFVTGAEVYDSFRGVLTGNGDNAGKIIYLDTVVEETEDALTASGHLIERGIRPAGVNIHYDGCFSGDDTVNGGFLMSGPQEGSGSLDASFVAAGAPVPGAIYGKITFSGQHGELRGAFVVTSYPGGANHGIGKFVLLGGTGAYEGLYGYGKVVETAVFGQPGTCDGPKGYWIGEAFGS